MSTVDLSALKPSCVSGNVFCQLLEEGQDDLSKDFADGAEEFTTPGVVTVASHDLPLVDGGDFCVPLILWHLSFVLVLAEDFSQRMKGGGFALVL